MDTYTPYTLEEAGDESGWASLKPNQPRSVFLLRRRFASPDSPSSARVPCAARSPSLKQVIDHFGTEKTLKHSSQPFKCRQTRSPATALPRVLHFKMPATHQTCFRPRPRLPAAGLRRLARSDHHEPQTLGGLGWEIFRTEFPPTPRLKVHWPAHNLCQRCGQATPRKPLLRASCSGRSLCSGPVLITPDPLGRPVLGKPKGETAGRRPLRRS